MSKEIEKLRRELTAYPGIASTHGKRGDVEMRYFIAHKRSGVRLRGKYRP